MCPDGEAKQSAENRLKSVIILHGNEGFTPEVVVPWLASFSNLAGIVRIQEAKKVKLRRIKNEYRRSGALGLIDVFAMRMFHSAAFGKGNRQWLAEVVLAAKEKYGTPKDIPEIVVKTPNSPESLEFIRQIAPDFMIARCKFILKKKIFSIPKCGTFVIHPGITPEYRNSHGCFWAMVRDDNERIGATLLKIDEGIDTGPILAHYFYNPQRLVESHIKIQDDVVWQNLDAIADKITRHCLGEDQDSVDVSGRDSMVWGQPRFSVWSKFVAKEFVRRILQ